MITTPRTHGRCAAEECASATRAEAIKAKAGRWHLVHGHIYVEERRTFVVHSWAEACDEHREAVTAVVRADVETWQDRWAVQVRTLDYGTPEASSVEEVAHGLGAVAEGQLF